MAKLKLSDRVRASMRFFRQTKNLDVTKVSEDDGVGFKALPLAWPEWVGGQPQWHMVDVESYIREGYRFNSLVYSAVMYKVRATMTAPLRVYTCDEYNAVPVPKTDVLAKRISRPNDQASWAEFQARNIVFLNVAGNVYIYIDPKNGEMHSLRPDRIYIIPTKRGEQPTGLKGYLYVPEGASPYRAQDCIPILPDDMLHIKLPNPLDPLEGYGYGMSPLTPAAQVVDVDNIVTKYLNMFFNRGAMVTGILSFDLPLKDEVVDLILERWKQKYGGYQNWDIGVLDRGGKYTRTSLTFEEMGFKEIDNRSETRILGPFGIAPILVHAKVGLEASTYSNYEAARQAVWEDTLVPEMTWFEVEYQGRFNRGRKFVQFDYSRVPALQRALPRQVAAAYTMIQTGVPPNQAYRVAGLRIGDIPNGDQPLALTGPGVQQGPRSDPDEESWGMREDVPE